MAGRDQGGREASRLPVVCMGMLLGLIFGAAVGMIAGTASADGPCVGLVAGAVIGILLGLAGGGFAQTRFSMRRRDQTTSDVPAKDPG